MTLMRYQIRNDLADKELYRATNKDPEALLEDASMDGLVGVLRQLGDLVEFAAEVFHCLHEELMTTAARAHGLSMRLEHLEVEFPSILTQIDHSTFFNDHEENLIAPHNLPHCIMDSYEECRGPPQLFLLDKFDVVGSGSCLKRYSDPYLLKKHTASKLTKDERPRKTKKKVSHTTSGETPEDSRTSHAKLHQIFLLGHFENEHTSLEFHVKLKRRQLNGPSINSSSWAGYIEKFLKNSSSYCERVHRTLDQSYPAMETQVTVCRVQEDLPIPSMVYPNSATTKKYTKMEMESIDDDERLEIPFVPHEIMVNEKSLPNIEGGPTVCLEISSYVSLCCKPNNDTYAPTPTESKVKEAYNNDKACRNLGFPGFVQAKSRTNADVTQVEVLAQFCNVLHHSPEEGESSLLCSDNHISSPKSKSQNAEGSTAKVDVSFSQMTPKIDSAGMGTLELEQSPSLALESNKANADGIQWKSFESCKVFEVGRAPMLNISLETHPEHQLKFTQSPLDASECGTKVFLTNYIDDHHSQHVLSVDTESEISLSALVENQFSSITKQEMEALEPEGISSKAGLSIRDSRISLKETQTTLESDCLLPNQYINTFDTLEGVYVATDEHDNVVSKEDETNSQDESCMNTEQPGHISNFEISSKMGTLVADTPRDLHTANENLSASSWQEDELANLDLTEISSYSEHEDPHTISIVSDDNSEPEVPIPNTQRHGTCFRGDVDHDNQTVLNDEGNEIVPKTDLENISDSKESLLGTQECLSPECHIQTHDLGQENQSKTGSTNPITASAESLPCRVSTQDVQENCMDVSPEPTVSFSMSLRETPKTYHEITPPLPPLPPTQWWIEKLVEPVKAIEPHISSVQALAGRGNNSFYNHRDENTHNGSVTASETHNFHVYTVEGVSTSAQTNMKEPSKTTEEQSPSTVNGRSDTCMHNDERTPKCLLNNTWEESFASVSLLTNEVTETEVESRDGLEDEWRSEAMALEWFSKNLREHTNPNPEKLGEEPRLDHPLELPDENGKTGKLPRDKDSLVIGIDRSMLRKVSKRNMTQIEARVDENYSLIEIIKSKSFNLRPTNASVRPKFQVAVPITNLKVAAILEKANILRQAMAGSDEEHDSDSWNE